MEKGRKVRKFYTCFRKEEMSGEWRPRVKEREVVVKEPQEDPARTRKQCGTPMAVPDVGGAVIGRRNAPLARMYSEIHPERSPHNRRRRRRGKERAREEAYMTAKRKKQRRHKRKVQKRIHIYWKMTTSQREKLVFVL